jgi:2,3-bisphosphoglycerate-dependent phosphoglycerate mutase
MANPVPQPALFAPTAFPTELLLVRHGQSAAIVPGTPESHDPPLSELGASQAAKLAERLAPKQLDAVYASDTARASATAAVLAEPRGLQVVIRTDLREVDLGEWSGGGFRQRAAAGDPAFIAFAEAGRWDLVPGSEGDERLRARATGAVDEIAATHPGGTIAIVCHGGFINAYLTATLGIERSLCFAIDNTSVTIVRAGDGGRRMVITVNDCNHLYDVTVVGVPVG